MSASEHEVAIVGWAADAGPTVGRTDAELLAPVVDAALAASGLGRDEIGVVCTASSEFLCGVVGTVMGAFDAFPGWPPRIHSHHEGDGAFALHEAWIRLLAGDAEAALVCAFGRPLATAPRAVLDLQLDPYLMAPLGVDNVALAAMQAQAVLDSGLASERDLSAIAAARRGRRVDDVLAEAPVAPPLGPSHCSEITAGAAAVVLASGGLARRADRPVWIAGVEQAIETASLGSRDLTESPSIRVAATRLGLRGATLDTVELHTPFAHHEPIVLAALGAASIGDVTPSGGALAADPPMVTGLIRIAEAAAAVADGRARRAVAHATNGPCLQHNLLCDLHATRSPGQGAP